VHILLLNEYFPPDTSATAKFASQVAEALAVNHRVTVLAGRPSYDPSQRHARYLLRREVRGNLAVERVGSTAYPRFQMRRRVSNYLTYLSLAIPRALSIRSDIVLAMTDPPIEGIAGALVARFSGRPFVYNIRDMYPDMAVGGSIVRPGSFTARWEKMHRWALRRAARVIVLGEDMRDPKTMLQEWAQSRARAARGAPEYRLVRRDGPDHAPHFVVEVSVAGEGAAAGEGRSKREAQQAAAKAMLDRLDLKEVTPALSGACSE